MSPVDAFGRPNTVLLLGATSGIGRAIVSRMVGDGARRVLLAGRDPEQASTGLPASIESLYFDATDTVSHRKFFELVFEERIDVVILAFGVLYDQREVAANPELAVEMAEVNFVGAASALLHTASRMREQGSGRLIVLSSVAGVFPRPSNYAYGSSKTALDFLARGLTKDLGGTEVGVMVVRPGFVHTAMTEGKRPAPFAVSPDQVASAVRRGLASNQSVVWVPPNLRWVMLGLRMLPHRLLRRIDR